MPAARFTRPQARYLDGVATVQPNVRPRLRTERRQTKRRRRFGRYAAVLAYLAALGLVVALSAPVLFSRSSGAQQASTAALPARPANLPSFIPGWAWEMSAWHETKGSERGRRPHGAPHPLPKWYWAWHAWRTQVQRHTGSALGS